MNSKIPKLDIKVLQQDVINLLQAISDLMGKAKASLSSDGSDDQYGNFQKAIDDEQRKVKKLELIMAIVAPMKAGKSTIINAIIGQELLPSRNAAMTTIPTEISLIADQPEPIITINSELSHILTEAFFDIQKEIRKLGKKGLETKLGEHPHLKKLALTIASKNEGSLKSNVKGREQIKTSLLLMNDIIRFCTLFELEDDPLELISDFPRISTPFWHNQDTEESNLLGNLVIIDTPGPNEAGENLRLQNVVKEQLKKSSLVLLVLDFTQLKTEAAEKVKQDVEQVIKLRNKDDLYVLVNKVDQRREGDMTPKEVQNFVKSQFGIGILDNKNRVFEVSARWAFYAASFLQELQENQNISKEKMKTAKYLAQEVFGIDWEEELEDATIELLEKKAKRLFKKSGFKDFLDNAIKALMSEAAPRCINSSLTIANNHLTQLKNDLVLRNSAMNKDEAKLREQATALQKDLEKLNQCRSKLQQVDIIRNELDQDLKELIQALKKQSKVSIETYFVREEYQRASQEDNFLIAKLKQWDIKGRHLFLKEMGKREILPKSLSNMIKNTIKSQNANVLEFSEENEAKNFSKLAVNFAKDRATNLLDTYREITEIKIKESLERLNNLLKEATEFLLKNAYERLEENFNIKLTLPQLNISQNNDLDFIEPKINKRIETYTDYKIEKKKRWFTLFLFKVDTKVPVTKTNNYYSVSLKEVVDSANIAIENSINNINQEVSQYLDQDFTQRVNEHFQQIETVLNSCKDKLIQAQNDQKKTEEQKEFLKAELSSLIEKSNTLINNLQKNIKATKEFLNSSKNN